MVNIVASPGDNNEPLYDTLNPRRLTVATTAIDDVIPDSTYDAPIMYAATGGGHGPATGRVTDFGNDDAVAKPVYSLADPMVEAAAAATEHVYGLRPAKGSVTYDFGSNSARGSLVYDMGNSEDAIPADDDDDDDGIPVGRMDSVASIMTNWGDNNTTYDNPRIEQQDGAAIPGTVRRESII